MLLQSPFASNLSPPLSCTQSDSSRDMQANLLTLPYQRYWAWWTIARTNHEIDQYFMKPIPRHTTLVVETVFNGTSMTKCQFNSRIPQAHYDKVLHSSAIFQFLHWNIMGALCTVEAFSKYFRQPNWAILKLTAIVCEGDTFVVINWNQNLTPYDTQFFVVSITHIWFDFKMTRIQCSL